MKRLCLVLLLLILAAAGCSPADRCSGSQTPASPPPALRVLFVGNSYTYTNDLPGVFTRLACSGGHKVETGMSAQGGWTLADHAASPQTAEKLKQQKWDYVILQEQSEIPAVKASRGLSMYPAARTLVAEIRKTGAQPLFFVTWAHRDGLPHSGLPNFTAMQTQLDAGYSGIARELKVAVIPVGDAWQKARSQPQPIDLWQPDGSHPNPSGTYLAACVFYAALFQQTPQGLDYRAGLSKDAAQALQTLAAETVIKVK